MNMCFTFDEIHAHYVHEVGFLTNTEIYQKLKKCHIHAYLFQEVR